ncbi:MAG: trans-sulfuration enzyme family protein [Armatimonadota bacterium]
MENQSTNLNTQCIHAGEEPDPTTGAVVPPIYQTTTFNFRSSEDIEQFMRGERSGYIYSRYANPTLTVLEKKMAILEGAEESLCLASGNAATTTAILFHAGSGDHLISTRDVYGGTYAILTDLIARAGVETTFVDSTDLSAIEDAFKPNTKLVFIETPTNPTIRISDIKAISELAHSRNTGLVVDNTFATPYNQNPISLGADLVTHSMTKFLNGHSDVTGGIIAGRRDDIARCREIMKQTGASLNPFDGWLVIRGLKTLAVRMDRHNQNAMQVAEYLSRHPAVERVSYPGLPNHPQHELAVRQMRGFGGMVSFVVKGGYEGAARVIDGVQMAMRAVSLGSIETLITQPAATSHNCVPKEERERAGIVDGLIRLSVGIEDVSDIIADMDGALSTLK